MRIGRPNSIVYPDNHMLGDSGMLFDTLSVDRVEMIRLAVSSAKG